LGNGVPHLHTHITARYADGDVNPGAQVPGGRDVEFSADELLADAEALRRLLS